MIPKGLTNAILSLVTLVWAGNFAASVLVPGYVSDPTIHFVFMFIAGGLLAIRRGTDSEAPNAIERVIGAIRPPPPPPPPADPPERPE